MSLRRYQVVSANRADRWHNGDMNEWGLAEWANALAGELGELCGAVKEANRKRDGAADKGYTWQEIQYSIAMEAADTLTYLLLVCERAGIDLEAAFVHKFNEVSSQRGFPEILPVPSQFIIGGPLEP